jgi:hypothetical protein
MSFITSKLMGGLGNYLFQIAITYTYSKKMGKKMLFNINDIYSPHKPYNYYTNNIFRKIEFNNITDFYTNVSEKSFEFNEIPNIDGNVTLNGYFQSEKYFIEVAEDILNLFEIDENTENYLSNKYSNSLSGNTCSIHIRRGDYLKLPNLHPTQDLSYYIESYNIIGNNFNYLIFSDDIEWCYENFNFIKNKIFITGNTDFQDLYLMSMCDNNIIANSTFSWWGAWLNKNKNKIVIAPKLWFGNEANYNTIDLLPENWFKI